MTDILQIIPATAKKAPNGWYSFNAPCCIHNGETQMSDVSKYCTPGDTVFYNCYY